MFSKKQVLTSELEQQFTSFAELFNNSSESVSVLSRRFDDLDDRIIAFANTTENGSLKLEDFKKYLDSLKTSSKATSVALKGLTLAVNALAGIAIGMAIEKLYSAYNDFVNKYDDLKERANGFTNSLKEFQDKASSGLAQIDGLAAKYNFLADGVDNAGHNISLTNSKYEEYKSVVSELSSIMPGLTNTFDAQGQKIGFVKGKLEDANKEYDEYLKKQAQEYFSSGNDDDQSFQDVLDSYKHESQESFNTGKMVKNVFLEALSDASTFGFSSLVGNATAIDESYTDQAKIDLIKRFKEITDDFGKDSLSKATWQFDADQKSYIESVIGASISDLEDMTDEEFAQYQSSLDKKIDSLQADIDKEFSNVSTGLMNELYAYDPYTKIEDENVKNNISSFVSSISSDLLKAKLGEDVDNETLVRSFVDDIVDLFNQEGSKLHEAYSNLLKLDSKDISADEYLGQLREYVALIGELLGLDPEQNDVIKKALGLDTKEEDITALINNVKKKVKGTDEDNLIQQKLSLEDLKIAANLDIDDDIISLSELIEKVDQVKKAAEKSSTQLKSFNQAWKDLDNVDSDSELSGLKDTLLELAKNGELTKKVFKETPGAKTFLAQIGLDADEAISRINQLVDYTQQLSSMRTGVKAITGAYDEKKDSKSHTVSASTLSSMYDTLGIENWSKANAKAWNKYKKAAADGKKDMSALQKAQNKLATAYVRSNDFLSKLTKSNKDEYVQLLEEMGVTNAASVVHKKLSSVLKQESDQKKASKYKSEALTAAQNDLANKTHDGSTKIL